jgi:ribosomal protein S18 acetylase RimI-like enzyme
MVEIEICNKEQLPLIQILANEIWPEVYDYMISTEQIQYMLNKMYSLQSLEEQWQNGHQFIVLYDHQTPVGFASFEKGKEGNTQLHKLYLKKQEHHKGLGKKMLNFVLEYCRSHDQTSVTLNVNRNNKSLAFYIANGFQIMRSVDISIGEGFEMNDYIMHRSLL